MKTRAFAACLASLLAVTLSAAPAAAKGATRATITGPGLEKPIVFTMDDDSDGIEAFGSLTGIFPSIFETVPDPTTNEQPQKELGPRYDIAYLMKFPHHEAAVVHQDLYPYARPHPVLHTAPGQRTSGEGRSTGGWYVAGPSLLPLLVSKGLSAPAGDDTDGTSAAANAAPAVGDGGSSDPGSGLPWPALAAAAVVGLAIVTLGLRKIVVLWSPMSSSR